MLFKLKGVVARAEILLKDFFKLRETITRDLLWPKFKD